MAIAFKSTLACPGVNELYTRGVHHGAASFEEGNTALKPETGQKIELLWLSTGKSHEIRATTFYQQSQNFIALFPMATPVLTVRGAFLVMNTNSFPRSMPGQKSSIRRNGPVVVYKSR